MNTVQKLCRSVRTVPNLLVFVTFIFCCFYLKTCQCMVHFHPLSFQTYSTKKTGYMKYISSGHKGQSDKKKDDVSHILLKTSVRAIHSLYNVQAFHD